ncbi:hypothetical protein CEXT_406911 [Caerostris extrusa]|uniref:Uncharacterized protein n=1 Tax=Caerostris extrusa TaxID=172846 RepID=A0AAV4XVB8_CAEEX|nr:hypothetical protein CEXT_406911 [Caerostris extrusa]
MAGNDSNVVEGRILTPLSAYKSASFSLRFVGDKGVELTWKMENYCPNKAQVKVCQNTFPSLASYWIRSSQRTMKDVEKKDALTLSDACIIRYKIESVRENFRME